MNEQPGKTLLYLIRHGATAANEQVPYVLQGSSVDNPLSPTGERQAAAVAEFLKDVPLAAVYGSHLTRAMQTAGAIARRQNLAPILLESIHEIDVGQWEGLSWTAIKERHRETYDAFHASPGTVAYLGGESYSHVLERAEPVFTSLLRRHIGQQIAVVAHNVVNRAYLSHLLGLDINYAKGIEQTNTGINLVEYDSHKDRATVVTLNSNFHVPGVAARFPG